MHVVASRVMLPRVVLPALCFAFLTMAHTETLYCSPTSIYVLESFDALAYGGIQPVFT